MANAPVNLNAKQTQALALLARDAVRKALHDDALAAAAYREVMEGEPLAATLARALNGTAWSVELATVEQFGEKLMAQVTLVGRGALGYHVAAFIIGERGGMKGEWSSRAY